MLLEFGAKNYYSFREGFEISLRLNSGCPEEISHNKQYSNILCIKGANGSGKTNALKALSFLKEFCCNSFNEKPDEEIRFESFFGNSEPTEFYVIFSDNDVEYKYELVLTRNEIISEVLYRKEKRITKLLNRHFDVFTYTHPDFKELKQMKLRKNASFISTANQYEIPKIKIIYEFFNIIMRNVSYIGLGRWTPDVNKTSEYYYKTPEVFKFVKEILRKCDLGIHDIQIEEKTNEKGDKVYSPVFQHKVNEKIHSLPYINQSSGTKSLFLQLGGYKAVLQIGGVLVLDEFDINLHPDILPLLVELFENNNINSENAQLIFTTHNPDIMDILSKYRTILINKENNESYLFRLDEISGDILRNDRPISPIYRSGKIGGVPKI